MISPLEKSQSVSHNASKSCRNFTGDQLRKNSFIVLVPERQSCLGGRQLGERGHDRLADRLVAQVRLQVEPEVSSAATRRQSVPAGHRNVLPADQRQLAEAVEDRSARIRSADERNVRPGRQLLRVPRQTILKVWMSCLFRLPSENFSADCIFWLIWWFHLVEALLLLRKTGCYRILSSIVSTSILNT